MVFGQGSGQGMDPMYAPKDMSGQHRMQNDY